MFRIVIALVVLSCFDGAHGSAGSVWSYERETGPDHWGQLGYPICATGERQSPIDINTMDVTVPAGPSVPFDLSGDWDMDRPLSIINNGHTIQATVNGEYRSRGGPLSQSTKFLAEQFHFHWGTTNDVGSEHTVNGQAYPAEMHIVHYDSARFDNVSHAMEVRGGLAVFGFFLSIDQDDNPTMQPIIDALSTLPFDQTINLAAPFNLRQLLPVIGSYWSYEGSLTTPPCYESVVWTVFQTPIPISQTQMDAFRQLSHPIINNYRPSIAMRNRAVTYHTPPAE